MRAIVVRSFGGPEVLETLEIDVPEPGPGQVRVQIDASSLNPIDVSTRRGNLAEAGLMTRSAVVGLGWDVAGRIDAAGPDVAGFSIGDRVVGLRDLLFVVPGAHAEQVVLDATAVAKAPSTTSGVEAATLPLNGLTADGALSACGLRPGETLLVTGAAGGVGGFVVELAALHGIRTIAVAGHSDETLVRELGATEFVHRSEDLGMAARKVAPGGVHAVIDAAVVGIRRAQRPARRRNVRGPCPTVRPATDTQHTCHRPRDLRRRRPTRGTVRPR